MFLATVGAYTRRLNWYDCLTFRELVFLPQLAIAVLSVTDLLLVTTNCFWIVYFDDLSFQGYSFIYLILSTTLWREISSLPTVATFTDSNLIEDCSIFEYVFSTTSIFGDRVFLDLDVAQGDWKLLLFVLF